MTLSCAASLNATKGTLRGSVDELRAGQRTISAADPKSANTPARLSTPLPRVEHVRLEAPLRAEASPSTLLKFDVVNSATAPLIDLVLEISVLEKPARKGLSGRAIVRPFRVRGDVILQAGHAINYEMLLRNLSSDCRCPATVNVVSVLWLPRGAVLMVRTSNFV